MAPPDNDRLLTILRATKQVVLRVGFANVRMSDVAQTADISTALLHYHYKTKDALLAAAFEWAVQKDTEHIDKLRRHTDPAARLRALAAHYFSSPRQNRFWVDAWGTSVHQRQLRGAVRTLNFAWHRFLRDTYDAGVQSGQWTCADTDALAWRVMAGLDGLLIHQALQPETISRELAVTWAERIVFQLAGPADS